MLKQLVFAGVAFLLVSCGGGGGGGGSTSSTSSVEPAVTVNGQADGASPFIKMVTLGVRAQPLAYVSYQIAALPGKVSSPVTVRYNISWLSSNGYVSGDGKTVTVPVFGLYAGATNSVTLTVGYQDGSSGLAVQALQTTAWNDANAVYDHVTARQNRASGDGLGFSYFLIKSAQAGPVIMDTDGLVRWVLPANLSSGQNSITSAFTGSAFLIGDAGTPTIYRQELDGRQVSLATLSDGTTNFHHNTFKGKSGWLLLPDMSANGSTQLESNVVEADATGSVIKRWDLAAIIRAAMTAGGDDPTQFVRDGVDWFHVNAAAYDASDDSVIVSSRENFVIKLDYQTGSIKWILGDVTKHWYVDYPSLRAYALTVVGGNPPVGQHAVSTTSDGQLLLFNNGQASLNQPAGAAAGINIAYSEVLRYQIDPTAKTATVTWNFDNGQAVRSDYCSSAYQSNGTSMLVTYARAQNASIAKLVGLNPAGSIVFDFELPNSVGCNTAWNAEPVPFESLVFN